MSLLLQIYNTDMKKSYLNQSCQLLFPISAEFEPVTWTCRAPMPSGRLCPRKGMILLSYYSFYERIFLRHDIESMIYHF